MIFGRPFQMNGLGHRRALERHICCTQFSMRSCHCDTLDNPNHRACDCCCGRCVRNECYVGARSGTHGCWIDRHCFLEALHIDCILDGMRNYCYGISDSPNRRRCSSGRCVRIVRLGRFALGHCVRIALLDRCALGRYDCFRVHDPQSSALHGPFLPGC